MPELILASASKRRSEILSSCGMAHKVVVSSVKELSGGGLRVDEIVRKNAAAKAEAVAGRHPDAVILGADTLVTHGRTVIGKPQDEGEARAILTRFSGGTVEVHTGVSLINPALKRTETDADVSRIRVGKIDRDEVEAFFPLLGPYDKAGGFSIEGVGSMIFDDIEGSYFNILGLPMMKVKRLFEKAELDIIDFIDRS